MAAEATLRLRRGPPAWRSRLFGLGSVFGKAMRDGRRAMLIVGLLAGGFMLLGGGALAAEWDTLDKRLAFAAQMRQMPAVLLGLLGEPQGLESLGGFLSWRFGNVMPVILGIWSVLALSSTLAGEARHGTLDMIAASPVPRRWIAAEKALAHVTLVALAMVIASVLTWLSTVVFATVPGDAVSISTRSATSRSPACWSLPAARPPSRSRHCSAGGVPSGLARSSSLAASW